MQNLKIEAEKYFAQGGFSQALKCYRQMPLSEDVERQIFGCLQKMARKLWRQGKSEELQQIMLEQGGSEIILAHAALCGKESLLKLAESKQGLLSDLAFCRIHDDLRKGLAALRQIPELKSIAEGWISLWKGDQQRALDSFSSGEAKMPMYAKLGKAIVFLSWGKIVEAEQMLGPMRSFASKRFPALAKAMGWLNEAQCFNLDLLHASLDRLIIAEKMTSSHQKQLKGWLALRMGDQKACTDPDAALRLWDLAEKLHRALLIDVLKRKFLLAHNGSQPHKTEEAFFALYWVLIKEDSQSAQAFLEYYALEQTDFSIDCAKLRHATRGWVIDPPSPELQLFWLSCFSRKSALYLSKLVLFPSVMPESAIGMPWEDWEKFFASLDLKYGHRELYLQWKLTVLMIFRKPRPICECIAQMLAISPHSIEEWIPLYVQKFFELDPFSQLELRPQIEMLRKIFPTHFDLLRMALSTPERNDALFSFCSVRLSEPLYRVLIFQNALDLGMGYAKVRQHRFLLSDAMFGKSPEADWRFLGALLASKLPFPKKYIKEVMDRSACSGNKFEVLRQLARYGITAPVSMLQDKNRKKGRDWRLHYYSALRYAKEGKREKCMQQLFESEFCFDSPDTPEYVAMKCTLDFYETYNGPDAIAFESFSPIDPLKVLKNLFGGDFAF